MGRLEQSNILCDVPRKKNLEESDPKSSSCIFYPDAAPGDENSGQTLYSVSCPSTGRDHTGGRGDSDCSPESHCMNQ